MTFNSNHVPNYNNIFSILTHLLHIFLLLCNDFFKSPHKINFIFVVSAKDNYRYFVQLNYELLIEFTISFSKSHSLKKIIKNGQKMKKYNCMFYRNPEIRFDKNEKDFWTVTPESFFWRSLKLRHAWRDTKKNSM